MQSHILKVHTCLAVTCHLHFWQNDWNLLCATVVTQGWNKYQNKSQHRKLTQEKKILPPLLQGLEPTTFWSWIWHSNHWTIPNHNFKWQWDFWTSGENGTSGHQDIKWWWDFWTLGQQVTKELLDTRWQWDFHTSVSVGILYQMILGLLNIKWANFGILTSCKSHRVTSRWNIKWYRNF